MRKPGCVVQKRKARHRDTAHTKRSAFLRVFFQLWRGRGDIRDALNAFGSAARNEACVAEMMCTAQKAVQRAVKLDDAEGL